MDLTRIGFTKIGTLIIPLSKEEFGLLDEKVEFRGKVFDPKDEVHITVMGRALSGKMAKAIQANPMLESQIEQAIKEMNRSYEKLDRMYHVAKDIEPDEEGGARVVHAESIIVMVKAPGIERFYERLRQIIDDDLEVPPLHVTLYTYKHSFGIGLSSQAAFDKHVTCEVSPDELKRHS